MWKKIDKFYIPIIDQFFADQAKLGREREREQKRKRQRNRKIERVHSIKGMKTFYYMNKFLATIPLSNKGNKFHLDLIGYQAFYIQPPATQHGIVSLKMFTLAAIEKSNLPRSRRDVRYIQV